MVFDGSKMQYEIDDEMSCVQKSRKFLIIKYDDDALYTVSTFLMGRPSSYVKHTILLAKSTELLQKNICFPYFFFRITASYLEQSVESFNFVFSYYPDFLHRLINFGISIRSTDMA